MMTVGNVVDVLTAIAPVVRRPSVSVATEQLDIDVMHHDGLDVRMTLRPDAITAETEVHRREDTRLRVVDIRVVHKGEITEATGGNDVDVIFDAARLSTIADAEIAMTLIGIERTKNDLSAVFGRDPG